MKKLRPTTQFKKDFKRIEKYPQKVAAFETIAELLINEQPIPAKFRPHMLGGQYKGCMECHIEGDFLLIWLDADMIDLVRLGSHSELFK
ncbi:type II toxin-antitoxin system YafQ family toxin [Bacteroides sp.]|uniref:type II toxin-antitoxin system YafQ family toxin n=1 Tax=Bacteroides sp. TaxID=29523 RepID=UPI00258864E7|nr:type II toxin-antitoxin system YafQ family toxin [Bacteroides sp.]